MLEWGDRGLVMDKQESRTEEETAAGGVLREQTRWAWREDWREGAGLTHFRLSSVRLTRGNKPRLHFVFPAVVCVFQGEEKAEESTSSVPSSSSEASGGTPKCEAKNKGRL